MKSHHTLIFENSNGSHVTMLRRSVQATGQRQGPWKLQYTVFASTHSIRIFRTIRTINQYPARSERHYTQTISLGLSPIHLRLYDM